MSTIRSRKRYHRKNENPLLEDIGAKVLKPKKPRKPKKLNAKQKRAAKIAAQRKWLKTVPYTEYLKTRHWQKTRMLALKRAGFKCSECLTKHDLQVHHLNYKRLFKEKMSDLKVLCRPCHEHEHQGKLGVADPLTREYMAIMADN